MAVLRDIARALPFLAAFLGLGLPLAQADSPSIVVRATGAAPRCVDLPLLARTIERDSGLVASADPSPMPSGSGTVLVELTQDGPRIVVRVRKDELDQTTPLTPASCATATDLVSAHVASLLVPPAWPTKSVPELNAIILGEAVNHELAARGHSPESRRARLTFSKDEDGVFTASLVGSGGRCPQTTRLWPIHSTSTAEMEPLQSAIGKMLNEQHRCLRNDDTAQRADILATDLTLYLEGRPGVGTFAKNTLAPIAAGLSLGLAATSATVLVQSDRGMGWTFAAAGAVGAAGYTAIWLSSDDYTGPLAQITWEAIAGTMYLLPAFAFPRSADPLLAAGGLGLLGTASLSMAGMLWRRPISPASLRRDLARVSTPSLRESISPAELARIEADFRRTSSPISPWIEVAPTLIGAGAMLATRYGWSLALSPPMIMLAVSTISQEYSGYRAYVRHLGQAGLEVSGIGAEPLAGGGVLMTVGGAF